MKEMLMSLLNFRRKEAPVSDLPTPEVADFLRDYSIEVMPRTAEKVEDFRDLLPEGTRVYIAHIDGTPIEDMVATAARLNADGYKVMPHFPARIIKDRATLENWIAMYQGEADVRQALLLAGGVTTPHGDFSDSMQLMDTGLFDKHGFERLHIAGHPEGNRDIDTDGSRLRVDDALRWNRPADPHRHCRPRQAANPDQIRHRLRGRPFAEGAAKARDGCHQTAVALRADRCDHRTGRPQSRQPRFQHYPCAFLPAGWDQDECQLGH